MHRLRHRRSRRHEARRFTRTAPARIFPPTPRLSSTNRKSLLLGTALASTLFVGVLSAPTPASAVTLCPQPPGGAISIHSAANSIHCVNVYNITGTAYAIDLLTNANNLYI